MNKRRSTDASFVLPVLTVVCTFIAVGLILVSIFGKRDNAPNIDRTDAIPEAGMTEVEPPEASVKVTDAITEPYPVTTGAELTTETKPETEPPVQTIPVSIYTESKRKCTRVTEFYGKFPESDDDPLWRLDTWTYKDHANLICDLEAFAVFTSEDESIKVSTWDKTWVEKWEGCGLDDGYKVGFEFTIIKKDGEEIRFTVLSPSDTFKHEEYFELYLYDCVAHAHDSWYSHITEKTNCDDTKNVMVKITLRDGCYEIDHIILKAFVYDGDDDFDSDGLYCGAESAECFLGRK